MAQRVSKQDIQPFRLGLSSPAVVPGRKHDTVNLIEYGTADRAVRRGDLFGRCDSHSVPKVPPLASKTLIAKLQVEKKNHHGSFMVVFYFYKLKPVAPVGGRVLISITISRILFSDIMSEQ